MNQRRQHLITPLFVDIIPDRLEEGILYICERYGTAIHKCCCGCGEEVVTPLSPVDWSFRREGGTVTLSPSIGNWSFTCRSHYLIRQNRIVWAGGITDTQVERIKTHDKADKEAYIAAINSQKTRSGMAFGPSWSSLWKNGGAKVSRKISFANQRTPFGFWQLAHSLVAI